MIRTVALAVTILFAAVTAGLQPSADGRPASTNAPGPAFPGMDAWGRATFYQALDARHYCFADGRVML